jgi:hypothetical protein
MKVIKHWRKKPMKIPEDRKTSHAHALAELILWKWVYYPKKSVDSIWSSKFQCTLHRNRKINPKIYMETQRTLNSKRNVRQKEQGWRCHSTWFQLSLHSPSNKTSLLKAQKQMHRPTAANRGPRYKLTQWQPLDSSQRHRNMLERRQSP